MFISLFNNILIHFRVLILYAKKKKILNLFLNFHQSEYLVIITNGSSLIEHKYKSKGFTNTVVLKATIHSGCKVALMIKGLSHYNGACFRGEIY